MKGFNNIGNTCYLNSGLQMLIQNQDLSNLIITNSNNSEILTNISNFIKDYNNSEQLSITPLIIKNIVEQKQDLFIGYNQHDSFEFIIFLLNIIDDELKKNNVTIETIYNIKINTRIKCKLRKCLTISNHIENSNFLMLDLYPEINDLNELYRKFKSGEKLEDNYKYYCENCKDKRIASKRYNIKEWPTHLIIMFKRFEQKGNKIKKNTQQIDIPLIWRHNYDLRGAVIHSGSLHGGHYIYIGKLNDKWYMFNDNSVTEITNEDQLSYQLQNAYYIYYVKND